MAEPTQADREAAAKLAMDCARCGDDEPAVRNARAGKLDDTIIVQSFANHAEAARAEGYRQAIEDAAALIQRDYPHDKRALVPAIRNLDEHRPGA